ESRQHRHLPRERGAERVDRLHAQPLGTLLELPAERVVALERRARELARARLVRARRRRAGAREPQRFDDAVAHLARGLDREGDGGDLLRALDAREERQVALDEELRLAGAR